MGISEYINEKKKMGQFKNKQYIEFLRPVVNVFIGEFINKERECFIQFLHERVGDSPTVNCCQIILGEKKDCVEGGSYHLCITDVDSPTEYSINTWDNLIAQIEDSGQMYDKIKDFVIYIYNRVSNTAYPASGSIRINCILQADWVGMSILPHLVRTMKEQFQEYFEKGVELDSYCILDQKGYKREECGEERKIFNYLTLNELETLHESKTADMVYLLSNYTSKECLEVNSTRDIMHTAGLAILVKDGISVNTEGNDKDSYQDFSFREEAAAYQGCFHSLGKLKLEVDQDTIGYVVYKTIFDDLYHPIENSESMKIILSHMEIEKKELEHFFGQQINYRLFSKQTFYSLIKAPTINIAGFLQNSAGVLLSAVYGKALDYFWKINVSISKEGQKERIEEKGKKINTILRDAVVSGQCSLAEVYSMVKIIENAFLQYKEEYYEKYMASEQELKIWLENKIDTPNLQTTIKETGEPRVIYYLAEQYLNRRLHIEEAKNMYESVSECMTEIHKSVDYYKIQSGTMETASRDLNLLIQELETEEEDLLRGNIRNYYTQVARRIVEGNLSYTDFKRTLNYRICRKEILEEDIYREVIGYCDSQILNQDEFSRDISEEMLLRLKNYNRFTSEEAIYDLAFETIMRRRKYYANHVTFGGIYQEICFLVNPRNRFVKSTNHRMKALLAKQQLKLFFEHHYQGMDILFMEGCFTKESIHYYRLYQKAYEQLELSLM